MEGRWLGTTDRRGEPGSESGADRLAMTCDGLRELWWLVSKCVLLLEGKGRNKFIGNKDLRSKMTKDDKGLKSASC